MYTTKDRPKAVIVVSPAGEAVIVFYGGEPVAIV
jgi:hypothetical protein